MPIYEFKCLKCGGFVEFLFTNKEEQAEIKCPKCSSPELERILSASSYSVKGSVKSRSASQTRTCSGGSCTTYKVPGPGE